MDAHRPDGSHPRREAGDVFALVASWLVVGIPALWGIAQVVVKSLALFR